MAKSTKTSAKPSDSYWLKRLFYPHAGNNHHPHALRHPALAAYAALLLAFNVGYNITVAHSNKVLGFATAISQQAVIQLTNQQRIANGVQPLTESSLLDHSAMLKAQNMFQEDYWAHYAPSGKSPWYWFDQVGYAYTLAGENLARDFDTSQGVIDGWMNSPSHRANMLAPGYKEIGIAVLNGTLQGEQTTLVVQHFGTPLVLAASNSAPSTPTSGITKAPLPTTQPTQMPIQEESVSQQNTQPKIAGAAGVPAISPSLIASLPYQLLHPQPLHSWSLQQIVTVVFLTILMLLFLFDSTVIRRKNIPHVRSHSTLHAGILAVLIVLVVYSTVGGVL